MLPLGDVSAHPHHRARRTFIEHDGVEQVAPVPRFSRTPGGIAATRDGDYLLRQWLDA